MNYKFILRTDRQNNGQIPLYCRGTFDRKKKDISLKIYLRKIQFDERKEIIVNHPDQVELNLFLEKIKFRINQEFYNCKLSEKQFSPELFEGIIKGKIVNLNSFYEFVLNEIQNSPEFSKETIRTYTSQITKLRLFREELTWKDLTNDFVEKYKTYMIGKLGNQANTYFKSLSFIKSMINRAIKKDIVQENVFKNIKLKKIQGKREFLDITELKLLEEYYHSGRITKSQHLVLQYFLFSCYTGLRYTDVRNIRHGDIKNNIIQITMHKTKETVRVPLIDKARSLIPEGLPGNKIYKVITNQKVNECLKEIVKIVGIQKTISFHCARHTFATVGLTVGIPMEVISKLLGHRDLKTTQIYAKVIDTLKVREMEKWNNVF